MAKKIVSLRGQIWQFKYPVMIAKQSRITNSAVIPAIYFVFAYQSTVTITVRWIPLIRYRKTRASHVIKYMIMLSDALYIFAIHATETADFPSLIICHNVSYRQKSFSLPKKGKCFLVLYRTQGKLPYWTETNFSALHSRTYWEAKGATVYTCASDWFCRKNSQPNIVIMTAYRAVFCVSR